MTTKLNEILRQLADMTTQAREEALDYLIEKKVINTGKNSFN